MHSGVNLYVYRVVGYSFVACSLNEHPEHSKAVDLGLELVVEQCAERAWLGVHHDYSCCYALLAQFGSFVGHCHGKVVNVALLQGASNLQRSRSIGACLYHAHGLCAGSEAVAVVVEVVAQGAEVHLQYCLVHLLFKHLGHVFKVERARALYEYALILHSLYDWRCKQLCCVGKEVALHSCVAEVLGLGCYVAAHANELVYLVLLYAVDDVAVER